jgi:hypothetical protein
VNGCLVLLVLVLHQQLENIADDPIIYNRLQLISPP